MSAAVYAVATAYTAADIAADPHMQARGDLVTVEDPIAGPLKQQAPFPRLDGDNAPVPSGAPQLGADNDEIWRGVLAASDEDLQHLRRESVI